MEIVFLFAAETKVFLKLDLNIVLHLVPIESVNLGKR